MAAPSGAGPRPRPSHAGAVLSTPLRPILIASGDDIDLARPVEPKRHGHRPVEKVPVVADDQDRAFIVGDHFLQQVERLQIEVVGRLVENEQVCLTRELPRQQQA